nr:hypothetical protein CFP56_20097 [Quercus suber]
MECDDVPNNSRPSEQELPLEDFRDCELKSKPYVGMQFDSLDDVETFYKEFAKKEGFGIRILTSKKASRSDDVTSRIYIPSHYILQRWTKEANKELKSVEYRSSFEDEHHMSRALRSIHVCQRVSQLSNLAEKSEDIYKMIISDLDHTLKKAFGMKNELLEDKEDDEMDMHHKSGESADIVEVEDCPVIVPLNIKDPHVSQTKGRKKSTEKQGPGGRIKGGLEISLARATTKRRSCQLCGGYGHNRRTCKQYNGEGSDYQDEENITEVDDNDIDDLA